MEAAVASVDQVILMIILYMFLKLHFFYYANLLIFPVFFTAANAGK